MSDESEIEIFQRWLQNRLDDVSQIGDEKERERITKQIQYSIQSCIEYRARRDLVRNIADPFVTRESPVRVVQEGEVKSTTLIDGVCDSCSAKIPVDLDFCPLCGHLE
tara:strand:- start:129789 stop:130112 length:324 start_codon:yes stop_codon:yes gene_type:complete